jgi:hypothetical protein
MSTLFLSIGGASPNWMQHHLPWLAMLVLMFGMARDDRTANDGTALDG